MRRAHYSGLLLSIVAMISVLTSASKFQTMSYKGTITSGLQASFVVFQNDGTWPAGVFDASYTSMGDTGIVSYSWDFGDGSPVETVHASQIVHEFGQFPSGNYNVTLNVTDTCGASSSITKSFHYVVLGGRRIDLYTEKGIEVNQYYRMDAPYGFACPGETVKAYATVTYNFWPVQQKDVAFELVDPLGKLVGIYVARTNQTGVATTNLILPMSTQLGIYTVWASVDLYCVVVQDSCRLAVRHPLEPVFRWSTPYPEHYRIVFDASQSMLAWDGTQFSPIVDYEWDFGDGNVTVMNSPTIEHLFVLDGVPKTFNVTLKVVDSERCRNSTSQMVMATLSDVIVPDDYATIQEAINHANEGDSVFVRNGTYYEHVILNKTITLWGENRNATIIHGDGVGDVIRIVSDGAVLNRFTICNGQYGVDVYDANEISMSENIMSNNYYGTKLFVSGNVNISGNLFENNYYGFDSWISDRIKMRNNSFFNNQQSFGFYGYWQRHDIDISNTVDGKPIYYWVEEKDRVVPENAGYLALVLCSNITVQNLTISKNQQGVLIVNTNDTVVKNSSFSNCQSGVELVRSYRNILENCSFLKSDLSVNSCENNTIRANNFTNNSPWEGLSVEINYSRHNRFYHNNILVASSLHLSVDPDNAMDNGFPTGGNYWSGYQGTDSNNDGIGDIPYGTDRYPLMRPWIPPDIAIVSVAPFRTVAAQRFNLSIDVTVKNLGGKIEGFNLTAYANSTVIETRYLTLLGNATATVAFSWNTSGLVEYQKYVTSAYTEPLSGEVNTANNAMIDGNVTLAHVGDIDGDGKVDVQDLARVAAGFGSVRINDPHDARYGQYWHATPCPTCPHTPNEDINGDGKIDIQDLARISANFGWHKP